MTDWNNKFETALKCIYDLPDESRINKEEIIWRLTQIVSSWISENPEHFFQKMYRIDIPELRLKDALHSNNPYRAVAELILERQIQKYHTRNQFRKPPEDSDVTW